MSARRTKGATVWLLAGQALLRGGGITAVKLHALTDATELTTGSFYHHFGGMTEYLDALAEFYGSEQIERNLAQLQLDDPRERIRRAMELARDQHLVPLDIAMRDWAGSSTAAARAVEATDRRLLGFLADAFRELGFAERSAQIRAQLFVSSGVARVMAPWPHGPDDVDELLAILTS